MVVQPGFERRLSRKSSACGRRTIVQFGFGRCLAYSVEISASHNQCDGCNRHEAAFAKKAPKRNVVARGICKLVTIVGLTRS